MIVFLFMCVCHTRVPGKRIKYKTLNLELLSDTKQKYILRDRVSHLDQQDIVSVMLTSDLYYSYW